MKERPILFSGAMVRALLAGTKTQTRRPVKPQPIADAKFSGGFYLPPKNRTEGAQISVEAPYVHIVCPYGQPGDRLWVRESWQYADWTDDGYPFIGFHADAARLLRDRIPEEWAMRVEDAWITLSAPANFDIDQRAADRRWRPSIHMPRWASRITLEITNVRVERLQDINEADSQAEGATSIPDHCDHVRLSCADIGCSGPQPYRVGFRSLWQSINGPASWDANPWVWAVEFRKVTP
jgi:hypothetical protein